MAPDPPHRPAPRISGRGVAVAVTIAVVLGAGAVGLAATLDAPVGAGGRDAPAMPAAPADGGAEARRANLPPLALVLEGAAPADIAALPAARQVDRLRARADRSGRALHRLQVGAGQQHMGDQAGAARTYRAVLARDPANVAARAGLAMATAAGAGTLAEAAAALDRLAAAHPDDQTVAFNRAWVAFYRLDGPAARAGLERTLKLGAGTRLGRTAQALRVALDEGALSATIP